MAVFTEKDVEELNVFEIFLNPAKDFVKIIGSEPIENITIYDISGKELRIWNRIYSYQSRLNSEWLSPEIAG